MRLLSVIIASICSMQFFSCTDESRNRLPQQIIQLITEDADLNPMSSESRLYLNGVALPFISADMFDSSTVYVVRDSLGFLSGATDMTHWLIIRRGTNYTLLKQLYGNNFHFISNGPNEYRDLEFGYQVIGNPFPEYRRSRFYWNGSNYWLREIETVNGIRNTIPQELLVSIGYPFTDFELENQSPVESPFIYDSLDYHVYERSPSGDSIFILTYHSPLNTDTTWLFLKSSNSYSYLQILDEEVYCEQSQSDPYDLVTKVSSALDSILTGVRRYRWNGSIYEKQ